MPRNFDDWLSAYVEYDKCIGEAPEHLIWWVGASTIASVLRSKVWIDEVRFQWRPNLYIVAVAPPGIVSKTTTANVGFNLAQEAAVGVHFGPDITSWQALIAEMATAGEFYEWQGGNYPTHPITLAVDELGTFLDPTNREQVDSMIRLYDGKTSGRAFRKITKTQGSEEMHAPWVNMFACTTPKWLNSNFPEAFVGGGLLSRFIFLFATKKRQRVAHPSVVARRFPELPVKRVKLIADLRQIAEYVGPYQITEDAYKWSEREYNLHWDRVEAAPEDEAQGYAARKQTHLFKLAMVVSASRGAFPRIDVEHLEEAHARLVEIEPGMAKVLRQVGAVGIPKASADLVDYLRAAGGSAPRAAVFSRFYRRLTNREFDEAVRGAISAGAIWPPMAEGGRVVLKLKGEADAKRTP